jgi:hypothetical protein
MEFGLRNRAGTGYISGILRNLRLKQYNMKHKFFSFDNSIKRTAAPKGSRLCDNQLSDLVYLCIMVACAAARRAIGTR